MNKKQKKNEINEGEEIEDKEEIITLNTEEIPSLNGFFDPSKEGQYYNFNSDYSYSRDEINEPIIYYDWFSNSTTTSHVTNKHDIFITHEPLHNTTVIGVGQIKAKAEGKGTVELIS